MKRHTSFVDYVASDEVAIVTMSNAPASLFTPELGEELSACVYRASDEGKRAMVLQADGAVFSGGVDVAAFQGHTASTARDLLAGSMPLMAALEEAPYPIICRGARPLRVRRARDRLGM
jgi:enoyl-CoA hydratase/carnithine racemase